MNAVLVTISADIIDIVVERRRVGFGVEETAPLFARIPKSEAEKLTRAARALGTSKQRLLASLLAEHLEPLHVGAHEFRPAVASADVLTLDEAAELLRVEPRTIRELAVRGELPGRKLGREWRFARQALLEWLGASEPRADHAASGTRPRAKPASR
jgi:excisionase family DNA binding protein